MAPMGWSVVSAVTVAMLMAVIQWAATVAATPAGRVSTALIIRAGWNNLWDLNCIFILICWKIEDIRC